MVLRKAVIVCLIALCAIPYPVWGADSPPNAETTLFVYPSNHGFLHQTGFHSPYGWAAMYRIQHPGYFIEAQANGGEALASGTYRYVFPFTLLAGQLGGLLSKADDVVRIEAWDATTHECLMSRTFQVCDFFPSPHHTVVKTLTFSTWKRDGHRFEPRVYWQGLSGILLRRIELHRLPDFTPKDLANKAARFEQTMGDFYIDRGYVLCRQVNGDFTDAGDAAIWTGLYAASEAWRYKATHSREALERMQDSLRALHELYARSPVKGTLVRYIDADGRILPLAASKDTYTGFFFAVQNSLPYIKDKVLRQELLADIDGMADHFLEHDLAFVPRDGSSLELGPSLSTAQLGQAIEGLKNDSGDRNRVIRLLEAIHFYFLIHAQDPWPELPHMIKSLKRRDFDAVHRQMVPFLNGAVRAIKQLQRNVHRSAVIWRWQDAPYQKLDRLLLQILEQLSTGPHPAINGPDDIRVLASQSIHALHLIQTAGNVLPKPNRYQAYYQDNLWKNKALLKTASEWNTLDEDLITAVAGSAQAAASRTNSNHLTYLALFDLFTSEKDPALKAVYQSMFQRQSRPLSADYNAMLQIMQPVLDTSPDQTGMAFWTLEVYPENRKGLGDAYWERHRQERLARYGGEVSGMARDPIPVYDLQRDPFIWQRSARSMRGDNARWLYPPLDYLFAYWLARANTEITAE